MDCRLPGTGNYMTEPEETRFDRDIERAEHESELFDMEEDERKRGEY